MAQGDLLRSWKEISSYLEVNARTCRRWEKDLALPVHRIHPESKRSPVFAYAAELEIWLAGKSTSGSARPIEGKNRLLRRRVVAWTLTGLAVFLATAGFFKFVPLSRFRSEPEHLSIAVMPFKNLNPSAQDEYLSEGITQEIINDLALFRNVRVYPAADLLPGDSRVVQAAQSRAPGGADYIINGGLRRSKERLHLEVEIIRLRDRAKIMNLKLDEDTSQPFTVVNNLCQKISATLKLGQAPFLREPQFGRPETASSYEAFDTYIKGLYILNKFNNPQEDKRWKLYHEGRYYWSKNSAEDNELAIQLFNRALSLDNAFAQAYLGLALCYVNYINFGWNPKAEWLDMAEGLIQKAQNLSPDLPEYYCALSQVYALKDICYNAETMGKAFQIAEEGIKNYPHHPLVNSLAGACYFYKYGETGQEQHFRKALELDEQSFSIYPRSYRNLAYVEYLFLDGQFEKAMKICEMIKPHDSMMIAAFRMGEICYYMEDLERSQSIMEELETPADLRLSALFYLGMIAARKKDASRVEKIIEEIERLSAADDIGLGGEALSYASIYMGLGDKEKGYHYLSQFFSKPLPRKFPFIYKKYIQLDKNFDGCRNDAGFCRIIEKGSVKWPETKPFGSLQVSKNASKS